MVEAQLLRVPVAHLGTLEDRQDSLDGQAHQQGQAVLAVAGEDVVGRAEGGAHADLDGLLAQQWRPQAELPLALERGGLGVEAPDPGHVTQQADRLGGLELWGEVRVDDAASGLVDQLHHRRGRRVRRIEPAGTCLVLRGGPTD